MNDVRQQPDWGDVLPLVHGSLAGDETWALRAASVGDDVLLHLETVRRPSAGNSVWTRRSAVDPPFVHVFLSHLSPGGEHLVCGTLSSEIDIVRGVRDDSGAADVLTATIPSTSVRVFAARATVGLRIETVQGVDAMGELLAEAHPPKRAQSERLARRALAQ
jgi:hypothetical protein